MVVRAFSPSRITTIPPVITSYSIHYTKLYELPDLWDALLTDVERGSSRIPGHPAQPQPRRADEMARVGPRAPHRLWPRLALISCWAHGHASASRDALAESVLQRRNALRVVIMAHIRLGNDHVVVRKLV